jgi:predicted DNA-binding transcriptional regulator YafY
MRADRLLGLLLTLQLRGRTTAATLAEELGVTVRTIYRDLDALSTAGVPIRAEAGHGGGCELLPAYRSPLSGLNRDEARALTAIGAPRVLEELGIAALAGAGRRKLLAGLRDDAPQLLHFDAPAWFRPAEQVPHLTVLWEACRRAERVRLTYQSPQARRTRSWPAEPLGIVNKAGLWYLIANGARGISAFRISRITDAALAGERFTRPADFDLAQFWASWSAKFIADLARTVVRMSVAPELFEALPEIIGNRAEDAMRGAGEPDRRGWRTVQVPFDSVQAAASGCLGMSPGVEVIEPVAVRDLLVKRAHETSTLYEARLS